MKTKILAVALLLSFIAMSVSVMADDVNLEINVNGSANLNITVDSDDTEAREAIAAMAGDVYGNGTDEMADYVEVTLGDVEDEAMADAVCPLYDEYFTQLSMMPPSEFVEYMQYLGYDDQSYSNTIWNICQHRYILEQEGKWSTDNYNSDAISSNELVSYLRDALQYLSEGGSASGQSQQIGLLLDDYFTSEEEFVVVINQIYSKLDTIMIRLEALETTMTRVHPDEYCTVKVEIMEKYNLTSVKCGEHSTWYYMIPDEDAEKGYYIMGVTPVDENETKETEETCVEDWVCTKWNECDGELQIRTCIDKNICGTEITKPEEWQACEIEENQVLTTISGMFANMNISPNDTVSTMSSEQMILTVLIGIYALAFGLAYSMFKSRMIAVDLSSMRNFNIKREFDVTMPEFRVSKPSVSMPHFSLPKITLPKLSLPSVTMPKVSLPKVSMPSISLPKLSMPEVGARKKLSSIGTAIFVSPLTYFSSLKSFMGTKISVPFKKAGFDTKSTKKNIKKIMSLL